MSASPDHDDKIRGYLLGKLSEEDREEFEQRLFVEDELYEKLQTAEDELIDDFLTGDLGETDVELFHKNFLVSGKRNQKLRIGKAWRNYAAVHGGEKPPKKPEPAPTPGWDWRQLFSTQYLKFAAVAAVIIVAGIVVVPLLISPSAVQEGLAALDAAYSKERPLESRITDFGYAPFASTRGGSTGNVDQNERSRSELLLLDELKRKPTPAVHHALGKVFLAKKDFDAAIDQFEQALKGSPDNAQIYADLGAAQLEKGMIEIQNGTNRPGAEVGKGMENFAKSLQNLNKALQRNANLREALFNRALLHGAMGLLPQAEADWRKYLENDPNSKWADEARQRLAQIEQQLKKTSVSKEEIFQNFLNDFNARNEDGIWTTVSGYQNRSGNVVVEQLIDSYFKAAVANQNEDANRIINQLAYLGDLQLRKSSERFLIDLVRFYESTDTKQRDLIVAARELMKKGYEVWGKLKVDENIKFFAQARDLFQQAGDYPEAIVAEYWASFCLYRLKYYEQSRQILNPLLLVCENHEYFWLQVRILYLLSSNEFESNEHSKAVDFGLRAVRIAERINDSVGLLNVTSALIEYYRFLGSYPKALAFIQRSLPLVTNTALDPVQANRHYSITARAFMTIGLHDAAAGYQREALRWSLKTDSDLTKSQNFAYLGTIYGKLKNYVEAEKSVQLAIDVAHARAAESDYRSMTAFAALQLGNVYRDAGDFDKAVNQYTQSIELYKTIPGFELNLFEAHKGRLFCYLRQQKDSLTNEEISILFNLMEKYRNKISDENYRNTFFDTEQSVVEAAVDFEYSRMKNLEAAFNHSNSSRARSLLDLLSADKTVRARVQDAEIKFQSVSTPLPLETIKKELPEQAQVLQYIILEDKLLLCVISRDDFQVKMQPVSRNELNEKLLRYVNIISRPPRDDEVQELMLAKDLYAILIQPVEPLLNQQKLLCIVPDGTLSYLPFAALLSPQSGKYLFEEYLLMTSPSASVFLACSKNASRNSAPKEERILSVGNPTFDRAVFPDLDNLPAAAREATETSDRYKLRRPLIEGDATKMAVTSEIGRSDVIHLALHSKVDDEFPLRSMLLLAKTKSDTPGSKAASASDSLLYAYEIYNLRLSRTRLVVLSSCESAVGRYYEGEGMSSFARAFISAGVPLVVASLWPVESTSTERLMVSFHEHRTKESGSSTVEALRNAQVDMLRGSAGSFRRPYYWAAFNVAGGYASF